MAGKLTRIPFAYCAGTSVLHRIPAGIKLLAVIALSLVAYTSLPGLAIAIVVVIAGSLTANSKPWTLLKGSGALLALSAAILAVKAVDFRQFGFKMNGFMDGLAVIACIFCVYAVAGLYFRVTTVRELHFSLETIELWLRRRFHPEGRTVPYFSLGLGLMLGFIPRFFEIWEASMLSCRARSCKKPLRRLLIVIPVATRQMIDSAAETAISLEARALGFR